MTIGPQTVDLNWDETGVVPPVVLPDTDFVFRRMAEATVSAVQARPGRLVLDVGCGWALDAISLARKGSKVVGIEASTVMLQKARDWIRGSGVDVALVQATAEHLPFRAQAFDRVMCKGALDHFIDPLRSVGEMTRVLKPKGKAIIAVANFESLGCRISRSVYRWRRRFTGRVSSERQSWQIPLDHTIRFDYQVLRQLLVQHMKVEKISGVSLLWGMPWWGQLLARMPKRTANTTLTVLDRLARWLPRESDVLISLGRPRSRRL